jgi:hypothetical protein
MSTVAELWMVWRGILSLRIQFHLVESGDEIIGISGFREMGGGLFNRLITMVIIYCKNKDSSLSRGRASLVIDIGTCILVVQK